MRNIVAFLFLSFSISAADMDSFFAALAKVESSNNPRAINQKENALGIYQIRPAYFADSKVAGKHAQVFNPKDARAVCEAYFRRYAPKAFANGDFETLARLHNAGPQWATKRKSTNVYWQKIKKNLNK